MRPRRNMYSHDSATPALRATSLVGWSSSRSFLTTRPTMSPLETHAFMPPNLVQDSASCKPAQPGPDPLDFFGYVAAKYCDTMTIDYRRRLAANIRALLLGHGLGPKQLRAKYLGGNKRGKFVSSRTIGYILSGNQEAGLDAIVAIACSLGVEPYHLLAPELDPLTQLPSARTENFIEAEVQRRLSARLPRAMRALRAMEAENEAQEIASRAAERGREDASASHRRAGPVGRKGSGRQQETAQSKTTKRNKTAV